MPACTNFLHSNLVGDDGPVMVQCDQPAGHEGAHSVMVNSGVLTWGRSGVSALW